MLTIKEAQEETDRIRKEAGPEGQMLGNEGAKRVYEAAGLDADEMLAQARENGIAFGIQAEFDQPPYMAVCSGMWSDGFIAGVIYGRAQQMKEENE